MLAASRGQEGTISSIASTILKQFQRLFDEGSEQATAVNELVSNVVHHAIRRCEEVLQSEEPPPEGQVDALVDVLSTFEGSIFSDQSVARVRRLSLTLGTVLSQQL